MSTNMPGAVDVKGVSLYDFGGDLAQTILNGGITANATTILLTDATTFASYGGIAYIENERISWTGKTGSTLTGVTRGFGGTTAATHATGIAVQQKFSKDHNNNLVDAMIATQTYILSGAGSDWLRDATNGLLTPVTTTDKVRIGTTSVTPADRLGVLTNIGVYASAADANPVARLSSTGLSLGPGGASATDTTLLRQAAGVWAIPDNQSLAFGTAAPATVSYDSALGYVKVLGTADWNFKSLGGTLNVKAYGAVGDGATDDTTAIQTALTAWATKGGTIVFPYGTSGTYKVTSRLTATLPAGVSGTIEMQGSRIVSTVAEPVAEGGILDITGTATSDLRLSGVSVSHTAAVTGLLDGILVTIIRTLIAHNVRSTGASLWGLRVTSPTSALLQNCVCDSNLYGGAGIFGGSNVTVLGGSYSSNGQTAPTNGYGLSFASFTSSTNGFLVSGIKANGNKRNGIDVHNGQYGRIIGNTVIGFENVGIYAVNEGGQKIVTDIEISDNYIDGVGASGANTIYGVWAGCFGATSTSGGAFIAARNTIKNTNATALSRAVLIGTAQAGGLSPVSADVSFNIIQNGCGASGEMIRIDNAGVKIDRATIIGNNVHSASALNGIYAEDVSNGNIIGNTVTVDAGTVTNGIFLSITANGQITGNAINGAATYTNATSIVAAPNGKIQHSNTTAGLPLIDVLYPNGPAFTYSASAVSLNKQLIVASGGLAVTGAGSFTTTSTTILSLITTAAPAKTYQFRAGLGVNNDFDIYDLTAAASRLYITSGGNIALGGTTTSLTSLLNLASGTTAANGIQFGTDSVIYRQAASVLEQTGSLAGSVRYGMSGANLPFVALRGISTDANELVSLTSTGLKLGPGGASATDVSLLRTGAATASFTGALTLANAVTMSSSLALNTTTTSGAAGYTVAATDTALFFTSTAATQTVTLPAASGGKRLLSIKNVGATNTFTVTRAGADTINTLTALGATVTGAVAVNGGVITLISDGTSVWNQVA